jgi:hypothetical protein
MQTNYTNRTDDRSSRGVGQQRGSAGIPNSESYEPAARTRARPRTTRFGSVKIPAGNKSVPSCFTSEGGSELPSVPTERATHADFSSHCTSMPGVSCRWCGSTTILDTGPVGPHAAKLVCGDCLRCIGFKKTPSRVKRARRFVLGFGPFAGKRLGELETSDPGRDHLQWLVDHAQDQAAGVMATIVLQFQRAAGLQGGAK